MQNSHSTRVTHHGASLSCHSLRQEAQAAGSDLVSMHLAPSAVEMAASTTHRNTNLSARAPNAERETCNMPQARQGKARRTNCHNTHTHTHTPSHAHRERHEQRRLLFPIFIQYPKNLPVRTRRLRVLVLSRSFSLPLSLFAFSLN